MTYTERSKEVEKLSYRDEFRLAQPLIQLARKEEEEQNPERRQSGEDVRPSLPLTRRSRNRKVGGL
jgi:hypothetical protein